MRFGPMNTLNGRKRLNVLLTRAIRSIDFFCSIESKDFKMSDNESVNLLKKWIAFSEGYSNPASISLPFDLEAKIQGNTLEVKAAHRSMSQARELSTFHRALQARDWKLIYS